MLQMRKGLKLPVSLRAPLAKGFRVFEHPFRDSRQKLRLRGKDFRPQTAQLAVWIGPEGDSTLEVLKTIEAAGALPVTLGHLTLRVETATVYCLSILNYELSR
jgi:16S rRNA (uracil1498-N3)-methyltransferase